MAPDDLAEIERSMLALLAKRKRLGEFDANAEDFILLAQVVLLLVKDRIDNAPPRNKRS